MKIAELLQEQTLNELGTSPGSFSVAYSDEDNMEITSYDLGLVVSFTRDTMKNIFVEFTVNGSHELTGRGNAVKILSTVNAIVAKHLPRFIEPSDRKLMFSADNSEPSRVSLYKRLVPLVTKIIGPSWIEKPAFTEVSQTIYSWNRLKK